MYECNIISITKNLPLTNNQNIYEKVLWRRKGEKVLYIHGLVLCKCKQCHYITPSFDKGHKISCSLLYLCILCVFKDLFVVMAQATKIFETTCVYNYP